NSLIDRWGIGKVALNFAARLPIEDFDVRAGARSCAGDNIGQAIAIHITRGDADATAESGVKGKEATKFAAGLPVEHLHVSPTSASRAGDDVVDLIAIDISGRHVNATQKARVVGEKTVEF